MLGRFRNLSRFFETRKLVSQGLRRAINTPVQGGAADVVIAAMVRIANDKFLSDLGFKQILQIHDEVILEGPEEHAEVGMKRVNFIKLFL